MTKGELREKIQKNITETREALQAVFDTLNQGQRKKLLKDDAVKALLDRYGVECEEG